MKRAILIDPYGCEIRFVLLHSEHLLDRQVYRYVRAAPMRRIVLPGGDTAWLAEHPVPASGGGQCYFAMPTLVGNLAIGGCCVITGPIGKDCASTLDGIDAAVLWLAGPSLTEPPGDT